MHKVGRGFQIRFRYVWGPQAGGRLEIIWKPALPRKISGKLARRYELLRAEFVEELATVADENVALFHVGEQGLKPVAMFQPATRH